jgi:pyroglutamyl-peptidase
MRVVLAGFGPFPGVPFNPSAVLAGELARRRRPALADVVCRTHVFATSYAAVDRDLPELFAEKPDLVLIFGVAGRRRYLSVETRARNALSVLYPDASGHRPARGTIERGQPGALRGAAPFTRLLGAVRPSSFPARLSRDAGRYLCNYAYWCALERALETPALVQFVHIPSIKLPPRRRRSRHKSLAAACGRRNAARRADCHRTQRSLQHNELLTDGFATSFPTFVLFSGY